MSMRGEHGCFSGPKMKFVFLSFVFQLTMSGYGYNIGTDVTLDFHHELSSQDSSYYIVASVGGAHWPFYHQNQINSRGFRPGQAGRVDIIVEQSQINVIIHITIQDLQEIDEGNYIVEVHDGTTTHHQYMSYVHVTYPPGQAECQIKNPPLPTGNWLIVSCNATLGKDDGGYLMCFQNSIQAPYLQPVQHVGHNITAAFWIDPETQFQCCSSDAPDFNLNSCEDFVYTPPPLPPNDITTTAWPPHNPSTTDTGSQPNHGNTSQLNVTNMTIILLAVAVAVPILVAAVTFVLRKWRLSSLKNQDTKTTAERREYRECDQVDEHALQKPVEV